MLWCCANAIELRQPRHGTVVAHDLADHAGRVQAGEARDVDRGLGVAGAHQRAALARDEGKDVAWGDDVVAPDVRVDRHRDGVRAVMRGYAGGDAGLRLDRDGERGLVPRAVGLRHQRQAKLLDAVAGHREADQATTVARHEVDYVGGRELRRDHQVALVLAVLVVDQDERAAVARLLHQFVDRGEVVVQAGVEQVGGAHRYSCRRAT